MADKQFTLRIDGMKEIIADFKKAAVNFEPVVEQAMTRAMYRFKNRTQANIVSQGITFQGNLGRSVQVTEASATRGVMGVGERYGGAVEFGRRAGKMPPVAAIERWASIKLGAPGAGFVIARKIGKVGTKANPFVEPAFRSEAPAALNDFKQAVDIVVGMMAGGR